MRKILLSAILALSGCGTTTSISVPETAPASVTGAMSAGAQIIADGQLVCKVGPALLAAVDPNGAAVLAKGSTATFVSQACASVNGIAVSPPSNGQAGAITVTVPSS